MFWSKEILQGTEIGRELERMNTTIEQLTRERNEALARVAELEVKLKSITVDDKDINV